MEIRCKTCKYYFFYKEGLAHFNRASNHYCSAECSNKSKEIHGMAKKDISLMDKKKYLLYNLAKQRSSKKENVEFNLELKDLPDIPLICPVLNIAISLDNVVTSDNSPSIDRINHNKGYIIGNIRFISNRANRIKNNATYEELYLIYKDLKNITINKKDF